MKLFTRILTALLALSMLVSLVACANSDEETDTTAQDGDVTTAENETRPQDALEFEFKQFQGDFTFASQDGSLGWGVHDICNETDEDSAEPVESAIFTRNLWIKDNFGCTVKEVQVPSIGVTAKAMMKAGTNDYDAYAAKTNECAQMSLTQNCLYDLIGGEVPYINMEHTWWDSDTVKGLAVNGRLYYATGDLFTVDNDATFILMFNKKLLNDHMATGEITGTPYEYVDNKEWTFDNFYKMAQTTLRGDGNVTPDYYLTDSFGLAGGQEMVLAFFYAAGLTTSGYDTNGDICFALEKNVDKADKVLNWAHDVLYDTKTTLIFHETPGMDAGVTKNCFTEGRSLFYGEVLAYVQGMRNNDIDFGIVPFPKYDTNQDRYYTYVNNVGHFVCIPKNVNNIEKSGMIVEAMAYKSVDTLTHAYYDINLIAKGTRDEESEKMLDLILSNRIYDLGYVFGWANLVDRTFVEVAKKGGGIASKIASYKKSFDKQMQKTIKQYSK